MKPLKTFIIYAHEDIEYKNELLKFLRVLERQSKIEIWSDGKISPGSKWDQSIKENLSEADIILPLVSIDFSDSTYIQEVEFKTAIERMDRGETKVVPILTKTCNWESFPIIKDLQVLPSNSKPIEEWPSRNASFTDVVKKIEELVNLIHEERNRLENQKLQEENQAINRKFLEEKAARKAAETEKATAERAKEEARKAKEETELLLEETVKAKFQFQNAREEAEDAREEAEKAKVAAENARREAEASRELVDKELSRSKDESAQATKKYTRARRIAYGFGATIVAMIFAIVWYVQLVENQRIHNKQAKAAAETGARHEMSMERINTLLHERRNMRRDLNNIKSTLLKKAIAYFEEDRGKASPGDNVKPMLRAQMMLDSMGLPPYETINTLRSELERLEDMQDKKPKPVPISN